MSAVQLERVLDLLRAQGRAGVRQTDVLAPTIDGGPEVKRLASRISELRHTHVIDKQRDGDGCAVYVLRGQRTAGSPPQPRPAPPCRYAAHRATDWHLRGSSYVVCGRCHAPAPGLDVVWIGGGS